MKTAYEEYSLKTLHEESVSSGFLTLEFQFRNFPKFRLRQGDEEVEEVRR